MTRPLEATTESAEDYRAAFELTGVGKAEVDPTTRRFLRVNAKFCETTGYTAAELLAKEFPDLAEENDGIALREGMKPLFSGDAHDYAAETRYQRKDGTHRWVLINARALKNSDGTPRTILAVIQDISARKQTELALMETKDKLTAYAKQLEERVAERTAKLEDTVKSIDSFCYGVAHDLRSPVRSVHGYASMLRTEKSAVLDTAGNDLVDRILQAAKHMDELIDGLLLYGRLSNVDVPSGTIDLNEVLNRVLRVLDREISDAKGTVDVQGSMPKIWGHRMVLEQIFSNLITNALKFVRPGVPPQVTIRADEHETTARVYVKDNGIGIGPEHYERIFRIFERLHSASKIPGTGIGLALVKKGVERLGGKVGVESKVGEGSCFWLDLIKAGPQAGE
jgi:PAS domain S-box-containing protein